MMLYFLFAFPVFLLLLLPKIKTSWRTIRLPPGPKGPPLIGNLHQLDNLAPHCYLRQLSQKYGPLMSLRLGFVQAVVVSSAKVAKEAMKTHDLEFSNRPPLLGQQKFSYNGLDLVFSQYNDYLKEMKKISVMHLFNPKRVESFRSIREDEVSRMIQKVTNCADSSKPANLSELAMALTNSVICRVGFGKRYEDEGAERSRFQSLLNEAQALIAMFYVSDCFPFTRWIDRISGLMDRLERASSEMDGFLQQIIDDHLHPNRPKSDQDDFIDVLLRLREEGSVSTGLSFNHLKAILMNIFIAGTDPIAGTIVWTMTALIKKPTVMKKVQQEVRGVVGERKFVNEDDVQRLPYLKAVIKETMRLHPVAPLLIPRETSKHCSIDGYDIPAKTLIYINAWAIGRDPEAWENPEEFYPERFLESSVDFKGQHYQLIPFGAGRRICPAIYMSSVIIELALSNLLVRFDWEMPLGMKAEDIDMDVKPGVTMHKKNDLCLVPVNV